MKGYRTAIFAVISLVCGILQLLGVDLPADVQKTLAENIDATVGALMTLYGLAMLIFRAVSDSPMFKKTPAPPASGQAGFARVRLLVPLAIAGALALAATACSSIPVPKTFSEQVAAGYVSLAAVRSETANLLQRERITVDQAQKIQEQADTLRQGMDVATNLYSLGKASDASQMLTVALTQLRQLEATIKAKGNSP